MTAIRNRLSAVIKYYGDTFNVGPSNRTGIFTPLPEAKAESYLTSAEIGAANRPLWAGYVPYDDATAVAATVSWNGLSLTVKRVLDLRLKNTTVARLLILAS
jgi:hypothetical protein